LFLKEEHPHFAQTILPPNDRSETKEELPQLKQTLFILINAFKFKDFYLNYIRKNLCKEKLQKLL
tara:strand:+ start:210 stop:404 length:195 start_codon:yes stop_codon:yes gene_type:complete